jgi:hypothetical protein
MSLKDKTNELEYLLDQILPELLIDQIFEEGEKESLSAEELAKAEEYFDAAIALMEQRIDARIRFIKKSFNPGVDDKFQDRIDELGKRVQLALPVDYVYALIITGSYDHTIKALTTSMERPQLKATMEVALRDWDANTAYAKARYFRHSKVPG